jgi:hypothetical protein
VFSDPAYQAIYEAYMEEGLDSKEAAKKVRTFIETTVKTPSPWKADPPWRDDKITWKKYEYDDIINKLGAYEKLFNTSATPVIQEEKEYLKNAIKKYDKSK